MDFLFATTTKGKHFLVELIPIHRAYHPVSGEAFPVRTTLFQSQFWMEWQRNHPENGRLHHSFAACGFLYLFGS